MRAPWIGALVFIVFQAHAQVWLPRGGESGERVTRTAYTLNYNERHEVANWVAYALRPEHLRDCVGRANNFREDPDLRSGSATLEDYAGSGYDRGHLAPAGDMKWSAEAMRESFYLSNITPQTSSMNRGRWSSLEVVVRAWAKGARETIVVTGPILRRRLRQMGPSRVSIPEEHFKVVLVHTRRGARKAIGFIMSQSPSENDLSLYALPVRVVEEQTGLDFFPHLTRAEQEALETDVDLDLWDFRATFAYSACTR